MKRAIFLVSIFILAFGSAAVFASSIDVTTEDSYYFYPSNSSEVENGYYASIVVNGTNYYLNETQYNELCRFSDAFATGYLEQFQNNVSVDSLKDKNATAILENQNVTTGDFKNNIDEEFRFHYKTGQAGTIKNAKIITKLELTR